MHEQELLYASASRQLLAATCGLLVLGSCKMQELLCRLVHWCGKKKAYLAQGQ